MRQICSLFFLWWAVITYFKKLLGFLPFIYIDKVLLSFNLVRYKDSRFSCSLNHPSFHLPQFLFHLLKCMIRIMHRTMCGNLRVTSTVMLNVQPCCCGSGFHLSFLRLCHSVNSSPFFSWLVLPGQCHLGLFSLTELLTGKTFQLC